MRGIPSDIRLIAIAGLGVALLDCASDATDPGTKDTTPPTVTLIAPQLSVVAAGETALLGATASDNQGVTKVEFYTRGPADPGFVKVGEDPTAPYTIDYPAGGFTAQDNGDYTFLAKAYDAAGNVGESSWGQLVVAIDATPPVVTLATADLRITTPGKLRFEVEGNEPVEHVELYEGTVKVAEVTGTFIPQILTVTYALSDRGQHTYVAKGFDHSGNAGLSTPLTIDADIAWAWVEPSPQYGMLAVATDGGSAIYAAGAEPDGVIGGRGDMVIVKYDPDGHLAWKRTYGGINNEVARSIAVGPDHSVYVSGEVYIYGAVPDYDCLLLKYDPSGQRLFVRQIGTQFAESGCNVAVSPSGEIYVGGSTWGTFPGNTSQGRMDLFLAKYQDDGTLVWTRQFGSVTGTGPFGDDYEAGIAVDPSGSIYLTGHSDGTFDGSPSLGAHDIFIAKYDPLGNQLWTRQLGTGWNDESTGITADPAGGVFLTGWNYGGLDAGPETPYTQILAARYGSDGSRLWTHQAYSYDYTYGLAVAADAGNLYITGEADASLGGGPLQGLADITLLVYDHAGNLVDSRALGSSELDQGIGVAAGGAREVYVVGCFNHDGTGPLTNGVIAKHVGP